MRQVAGGGTLAVLAYPLAPYALMKVGAFDLDRLTSPAWRVTYPP